jgi:hypothetical protein
MKSNRGYRWPVLVGLAILAGTLSAGMASARDYAGSFSLPFATQWGSTTLPAGDYSFRIDPTQVPYVARIYGKNANIIVMAQAVADYPSPERSELIIRSTQNRLAVRALYLAEVSLVFSYVKHEPTGRVLARSGEPVLYRRVFVSGR